MELYQLKTFLIIARTGNLTRAATELHASQPTVSGQLKALEEELNVVLFERTPRGMVLIQFLYVSQMMVSDVGRTINSSSSFASSSTIIPLPSGDFLSL